MDRGSEFQEHSLPDEAFVVRFGRMLRRDLERSALKYAAFHPGEYGISVFSLPDRSWREIASGAGLGHSVIRVSTVGAIRSGGYDVVPSPPADPRGHSTLMLPTEPTDEDWEKLWEVFGEPIPNPGLEEVI